VRRPEQIQPHPFDVENGVDTTGLIPGPDLASGHPSDRFIDGYAPVPVSGFRGTISRWVDGIAPRAIGEFTFVDLGCGKGRAVLLASELGFRGVVGVELNPALAATARGNVEQWKAAGKARCPVRIEQGDAAEFAWPAGACVAFLFNPFTREPMDRVVERLARAFRDHPDDLYVLYYKPEQAAALDDSFEMLWSERGLVSAEELAADRSADRRDEVRAYRLRR
jgi:SAM-dependent methyltransferase